MDQLLVEFQTHFVQWIIAGVFTFIGYLAKRAFDVWKEHLAFKEKRALEESAEQDLLKDGLLSLLRFRISRFCIKIQDVGEYTLDEYQDLEDMFKSYHALGGNGRVQKLYEATLKLPLRKGEK